jgi:hypothetical protein
MSEEMIQSVYFPNQGSDNTRRTLEIAKEYAERMGVRSIVVATSSGETGRLAAEMFRGRNVVAVTHSTGFKSPDVQDLIPENRAAIEKLGGKVLTTQHALGGVGRAVRIKLGTYELDEIIAHTLRLFGQGAKVACEISLMAADAGLIRTEEDCIAIGGSGRGADTALLLKPANAMRFFDLKVRAVLCKPKEF